MPGRTVPVLVPVPLDGPFDYRLGADGPPHPGTFVEVPFGGRALIGVVWDTPSPKRGPEARLKPLGAGARGSADAAHGAGAAAPCGPRDAGPARCRPEARDERARGPGALAGKLAYRRAAGQPPARLSRQRAAVLAALPGDAALLPAALAKAAGVGTGVVQAMARDGFWSRCRWSSGRAGRGPIPSSGASS